MGLGKILKLGGIDNSPAKTDQSVGGFRVARNVMPTPDNTIIPRYDYTTPNGQPADVRSINTLAQYDDSILAVMSKGSAVPGSEYLEVYKDNVRIPTWNTPLGSYADVYNPQSFQSYRINNTSYFLTTNADCNLYKYDGVEAGTAGCPQPVFSVLAADLVVPGVPANRRYIRAIAHTIDFDNNEPVSEYVQFTSGNSGSTAEIQYTNGIPATYTQIPSIVSEVSPQYQLQDVGNTAIGYVASAVTYTGSPDFRFNVTTTSTNITSHNIGAYVFVAGDFTRSSAILGGSFPYSVFGIALKVKSVSPLTLDATNAYLMDANRKWNLVDLSAYGAPVAAGLNTYLVGSRYFLTYWESVASTGIYYYREITPYLPFSSDTSVTTRTSITMTGVASASIGWDQCMFAISSNLNGLGGWYDVNTKKVSPNSYYQFGTGQFLNRLYCMTKFQGQLVFAENDYIWFSDTTLGGWVEQLNAANSLLVGDQEFGRITAICGTSDFLFVGRERKNYVVVGNIATGNYKVQEVTETNVGPWCNNSAVNVRDSVVFISSVGVFQITGGGKCFPLSKSLPKNFANYTNNTVNEDVIFRLTGYVSDAELNVNSSAETMGLAVGYDAYRDLLVWCKRYSTEQSLVLHVSSRNFYEWDGLAWGYTELSGNCLLFKDSHYYVGQVDYMLAPSYGRRSKYIKEDKTVLRSYSSVHPVKLYTTWLTNGEPSLEKEFLQLKMFGRIACTSANPLKVRHYKDWDYNTLVTDTTYVPLLQGTSVNSQVQYSHKKRLTSDKALAVSVGIEFSSSGMDFELESLEVELNPIQAGVKR